MQKREGKRTLLFFALLPFLISPLPTEKKSRERHHKTKDLSIRTVRSGLLQSIRPSSTVPFCRCCTKYLFLLTFLLCQVKFGASRIGGKTCGILIRSFSFFSSFCAQPTRDRLDETFYEEEGTTQCTTHHHIPRAKAWRETQPHLNSCCWCQQHSLVRESSFFHGKGKEQNKKKLSFLHLAW